MNDVTILLSTYNGERFLADLWRCLENQTDPGWRLLVRDDGSCDATLPILRSWTQNDERVELLPSSGKNLGPRDSFARLLSEGLERHRKAAGFLFCDQDDLWHPLKVQIFRELLAQKDGGKPALIHSDMEIGDQAGGLRSSSFFRYCGFRRPAEGVERTLMVQNFVPGCATALNRAAARLVSPIPPEATMHDVWAALLVAWAGELVFVPRGLLRYRLHGGNEIGVTTPWQRTAQFLRGLPASYAERVRGVEGVMRQAGAARERLLGWGLSSEQLKPLEVVAELAQAGRLERVLRFLGLRIPWARRLGLLSYLVTLPQVRPSRSKR